MKLTTRNFNEKQNGMEEEQNILAVVGEKTSLILTVSAQGYGTIRKCAFNVCIKL